MTTDQMIRALEEAGVSLLEDKGFSKWEPVTNAKGLLHCRRKRKRRYELLFLLHKGSDNWFLCQPNGLIFRVGAAEKIPRLAALMVQGDGNNVSNQLIELHLEDVTSLLR